MKRWQNGQFFTETRDKPLWKNLNFSIFFTSCFYSLERRFFVLEYRKTHFPSLYCQKWKAEKMANFWLKPWTTQFERRQFFDFFSFSFYSQDRRFFVLQYSKRHFAGLYFYKKGRKMAIFGHKAWIHPFKKNSIFRHFELLVFIA